MSDLNLLKFPDKNSDLDEIETKIENAKKNEPFQFGSRLLKNDDEVFQYNAWDHVETDSVYKQYSEQQYAKQREEPVSEFDKSK